MSLISKNECIYCLAPLYRLSDGRVKCSYCQKRYSPKKLQRELNLIGLFCGNTNALQASKRLSYSYSTTKKAFDRFRKLTSIHLEREYEKNREKILEYDEYIYLDHYKRDKKRFIFDGFDFLTFDYGGRVYNILMPSLNMYKKNLLADGADEVYFKEFSKFLTIHRVANIRSHKNTIIRFWSFFDQFIKQYKGIKEDNFFFYLKEAEFKFNYEYKKRVEILWKLWLN